MELDALFFRFACGLGIGIGLAVIEVRFGVGDGICKPDAVTVPVQTCYGIRERRLQVFRGVSAAVGGNGLELYPEGLQIGRKGNGFGDVLVFRIPVQDEGEPHKGFRSRGCQVRIYYLDRAPETLDLPAHRTGRIENETYVERNLCEGLPIRVQPDFNVARALAVDRYRFSLLPV